MKPVIDLSAAIADLSSLTFLKGPIEACDPSPDSGMLALRLQVEVSGPSAGYAHGIQPVEPLLLLIPTLLPHHPPLVMATRRDFQVLAHSERTQFGISLCLTRLDRRDWWVGKTVRDLLRAAKDWLDDAAADRLVKKDDPFEPLILRETTSFVEVNLDGPFIADVRRLGWMQCGGREVDFGQKKRVIIGSGGDIRCCALFQGVRQFLGWEEPKDLPFLLDYLRVAFNIDTRHLERFLDKRLGERAFVLVGIRRAKEILGAARQAEEWIAFELTRGQVNEGKAKRRKHAWGPCALALHKVRFTCSPTLARRMSGWKEDAQEHKVLLAGAGALGSYLGNCLGRSGLVQLNIVDPDILEPHNLPRHVLSAYYVCAPKGQALAHVLNSLDYPFGKHQGLSGDILPATPERLSPLLDGALSIIDATASPAVQRHLADLNQPRPPIVCVFQIASGKGTIVLAEGTHANPPLDALEPFLAYMERDTPVFQEWLQEASEPVQIGAGCRSPSARIPGTLVEMGASWAGHTILEWIGKGAWPELALCGVATIGNDAQGRTSIATKWIEAPFEPPQSSSDWRIWLPKGVSARMRELVLSSLPNETGGILIGEPDLQRKSFYVVDFWSAPPDSEASPVGFTRGRVGLTPRLILLNRRTKRFGYVGEWHSHPGGATDMSASDWATAKFMAQRLEKAQLPSLCVITNGTECNAHVVEAT